MLATRPVTTPEEYRKVPFDQSIVFRGRRKVIEDVFTTFKGLSKPFVVLTGLGGAGYVQVVSAFVILTSARKTSVAKECAYLWMKRASSSILWINADTVETISNDHKTISGTIDTSDASSHPQQSLKLPENFRSFLRNRQDWLLIFDNADNIGITSDAYIPPDPSGHVLFTSRDSRLARLLQNAVEIRLGGLPGDEAEDMFLALTGRSDIAEEYLIDRHSRVPAYIVKQLENFPLAIAQGASFLRFHSSISGNKYVQYLEDQAKRAKLLGFPSMYENYNKTVMTTWEVSYETLQKDPRTGSAAQLLCLLGFLDPAGVPVGYLDVTNKPEQGSLRADLLRGNDFLNDDLNFEISVDTLIALCLVHKSEKRSWPDEQTEILSLHPLVHEWVRIRLSGGSHGSIVRDDMIALSNALALHNTKFSDRWDDLDRSSFELIIRDWDKETQLKMAITRMTRAFADTQTHTIETILLACADILDRPWSPDTDKEQFLFDHNSTSTNPGTVTHVKAGDYKYLFNDLARSTLLDTMMCDSRCPRWADSTEIWSVVEKLYMCTYDDFFRPYSECLLAGLYCL